MAERVEVEESTPEMGLTLKLAALLLAKLGEIVIMS